MKKDLIEIPKNIKQKLEILPVQWIDEVLQVALVKMPEPLPEAVEVDDIQSKRKNLLKKASLCKHINCLPFVDLLWNRLV